jgi:hypothetical protein
MENYARKENKHRYGSKNTSILLNAYPDEPTADNLPIGFSNTLQLVFFLFQRLHEPPGVH